MKSATTWLYAVLRTHPELFFTPSKELHYFYHRYVEDTFLGERRRLEEARTRYILQFDPEKISTDKVRRNLLWVANFLDGPVDDLWYRNLFSGRRLETYCCDFSNLYALLPVEAWRRISGQSDRLRVLYTMRHPIERLWSHVKFHLQFTGEAGRLDRWGQRAVKNYAKQHTLWVHGEYGAALRRLKQGLQEDQLKVLFYEDLHDDSPRMIAEIEDFLGIAPHRYSDKILTHRVNASAGRPMPAYFPQLFAQDFDRIIAEIEAEGYSVPASWHAPVGAG